MATPIKFLLGKEISNNLKATEAGRLLFAGALSAQDSNEDVFKIYYDTGDKLVPMAAKEAEYAQSANTDSNGNVLIAKYAATLELIDGTGGEGDELRLLNQGGGEISSVQINKDVNQVVTTTRDDYPLVFGANNTTNTSYTDGITSNGNVRVNRRFYINASSGELGGVTLDGGSWPKIKSPNCCFFAGTPILLSTLGLQKNIENITSGEIVLSYDITTNQFYEVVVQKLIINKNTTDIAEVTFADGRVLKMNAYHPILTKDGFHSLTNHNNYDILKVGDFAKDAYLGWNEIIDIKRYQSNPIVTYNLAIKNKDEVYDDDTNDTFIANGIVVHNASCPT